jgi:glycosyltransferase involved in cell wall biosynthesis
LWGCESEVVYSVCDLIAATVPKEKMILTVGRFAADSPDTNYKAHDALIQTFIGMTDLHAAGWRLHLAGSLAPDDAAGNALLQRLQAMAKGFPVSFHVNAPLSELHDLHRRASIYWHAAGYGYDPDQYPMKQEHFGMTTVEAMSAGAAPIVIDSGGQRETVQDGVNGLRWRTLSELAERTRQVAADDSLRLQFAQASVAAAPRYSRAAYLSRMDRIIASLLS